jgi:probable phosphoglycerate mutase
MRHARLVADKVQSILGYPVGEVLMQSGAAFRVSAVLHVYLVRHAKPETPDGRRFIGQADMPLGRDGEEQARALADRLMEMTGGACFDTIYGSDLLRSRRTAEILADGCATPVQSRQWLREIDVGAWEGLTWEEAEHAYPVEHAARELDLVRQPFPGGESFRDLRDRVVPRFLELVDAELAAGHRRVLVLGHKGVNRVILAHVLGLPLEDLFSIDQDFCAVTVLRFPPGAATAPCC